jgi:hypothetical protein
MAHLVRARKDIARANQMRRCPIFQALWTLASAREPAAQNWWLPGLPQSPKQSS